MKKLFLLGVLLLAFVLVACTSPQYQKRTVQPDLTICSQDTDCLIRQNPQNQLRACHENDQDCLEWEKQDYFPPGNSVYPSPDNLLASCVSGECEFKYNCARCSDLEWINNCGDPGVQIEHWCELFRECGC